MNVAAAGIDAYYEANLLTGQASAPHVDELTKRALKIHADGSRLYVHWRNASGTDCQAVGPATRCFCGHSYSSHAWYETGSKRVRCRVDGCRCECFSYLPGRGSKHIICACKHDHEEHRGKDGKRTGCRRCACSCFHSDWRCGCGATYDEHRTVFETKRERAAAGRPTEDNLGGWAAEKPHLEAVCGGVTNMSSLLSGVEREALADGSGGAALSSTAQVFASYDKRA